MQWLRGVRTGPTGGADASAGDDPRALTTIVLRHTWSGFDPLLGFLGLVFRRVWWTDAAESSAFDGGGGTDGDDVSDPGR